MIVKLSLHMNKIKNMDADGTMFRIELEVEGNGHIASVSVPDHTEVINQSHLCVTTDRNNEPFFTLKQCL